MDQAGRADALPSYTPTPPLALSEFMAQTAPISASTPPSDPAALTPGASNTEAAGEMMRDPEQHKLRAQPPQHQLRRPPTPPDTPPTDWLATRSQLLPRRNQGNKADWIRGWSEAVSVHGDETYCACSEMIDCTKGRSRRKRRTAVIAVRVRAILHGAARPGGDKTSATAVAVAPQPQLCRNCSRPPSPPLSSTTSHGSDKLGARSARWLSGLVTRVRPRRPGRHAREEDTETPGGAWPENCQPRWATGTTCQKRLLVKPTTTDTHPAQEKKTRGVAALWPGRTRAAKMASPPTHSSDSELSGLSSSDSGAAPRGTMSRLQRAAALLQRTARPKD